MSRQVKPTVTPAFMSVDDVMIRLGNVSRQTVYNLIAEGRLQRVKIGKRAMIPVASVDALISELTEVEQ